MSTASAPIVPLHALRPIHFVQAAVVGALGAAASLPGVAAFGAHHGDEAYYMAIAQRMSETGNYIVPVFYDKLILDRAPLFYWLIALSYRVFGLSVLAARAPTLVATALVCAGIYLLAIWLYGSTRGALLAVLAFITFTITTWISRLAVPDMVMTVGVLAGVVFCYRASYSTRRWPWLLASSIGVGIAGMAKGHVGFVVAATPLAAFILADRRSPEAIPLRRLLLPDFWLPALLIFGWWYVVLIFAPQPVGSFAPLDSDRDISLGAALYKFMFAEASHQAEGGWQGLTNNLRHYLSGAFLWFVPWSGFLAYGFFGGERRLRADWRSNRRALLLLFTIYIAVLALFTFVVLELRSIRYALPVAPAVAILVGRFFTRPAKKVIPFGIPLAIAATMIALWSTVFGVALPQLVRPPIESLAADLRPRLRPGDRVAVVGIYEQWAMFLSLLLERPVEFFPETTNARGVINAAVLDGPMYIVTKKARLEERQAADPQRVHLLSVGKAGSYAEDNQLYDLVALGEVLTPSLPSASSPSAAAPQR